MFRRGGCEEGYERVVGGEMEGEELLMLYYYLASLSLSRRRR